MSKLNSVFAICLIVFTSFLVRKTLQVQHSCNPMIHSGELPLQCQVAIKNSTDFQKLKTPSLPKHSNKKHREQVKVVEDISKFQPNKPTSDLLEVKQPRIAQNNSQQSKKQTKIASNSSVSDSDNSLENTELESKTQSNPVTQFVNEHSDDIVGGVAGIAVGAGTIAAVGATAAFSLPVAGAALIGLGVWYAIRTVF